MLTLVVFFFVGLSFAANLPPSYQNITFLTEEFARAKPLIQNLIKSGGVRGPILVRLAWHDAGTYCKYCSRMGGPHALMRFPEQNADPADAGLYTARDPLNTIYNATTGGFNDTITLADFWQFGALVALEYMNGPHVPFRPGREDWDEDQLTPYDRLPDGSFAFPDFPNTAQYVRDIFYRMGFNDTEIVILIGGHTLGQCHSQWSGFFGPWTPDPETFDNDFYAELVTDPWEVTSGTQQYYDTKIPSLMMLQTDLSLVHDPIFLSSVKKYANDQQSWFKDFSVTFQKLQENGVTTLLPLIDW
jgi:cytochrome c peroxidase